MSRRKLGGKVYLLLAILLMINGGGYAQVGINTENVKPGVAFQVDASTPKGVLFPEVALTSTVSIHPFSSRPYHGCMVFNMSETINDPSSTNVMPGYYFWDNNVQKWIAFSSSSKSNYIFIGSNNDTNTNFNDGSSRMDLFYNVIDNQSPTLYQKRSSTALFISETGFYRVVLNLDMRIRQSSQDRDIFGVSLFLNGVKQPDRIVIRTKEYSGGTQTVGCSSVLYIYIPQGGAELSVSGFEIHGASDVLFNSPRTSTINIERIR